MTLTFRYTIILMCLVLQISCNEKKAGAPVLRSGYYTLLFDIGDAQIPARLRITENRIWCFHNWDETIILDSLVINDSTFRIKMPLFQSSLEGTFLTDSTFRGVWTDHSRETLYEIPFTARLVHTEVAACDSAIISRNNKIIYDAVFSPDSEEDRSKAVGVFYTGNESLVGTFMTESGDYRYLEGSSTGSSFYLSTFDGTHLFYFCANIVGDSLTDGRFYSGKHWSEDWFGFINPQAQLRDPDSLTFVKNKTEPFSFVAKNTSGDSVLFDSSKFAGKVTLVQIFGSWCPNCTDESRFIKKLYDKYAGVGLQIVPVAFERTSDFTSAKNAVVHQFEELELSYPPYIGGQADKNQASKVFASLSKITSYPTMIFIDKSGQVRKIHTGFYGPGTMEHYEKNTAEMAAFVETLLAEPNSSITTQEK